MSVRYTAITAIGLLMDISEFDLGESKTRGCVHAEVRGALYCSQCGAETWIIEDAMEMYDVTQRLEDELEETFGLNVVVRELYELDKVIIGYGSTADEYDQWSYVEMIDSQTVHDALSKVLKELDVDISDREIVVISGLNAG